MCLYENAYVYPYVRNRKSIPTPPIPIHLHRVFLISPLFHIPVSFFHGDNPYAQSH